MCSANRRFSFRSIMRCSGCVSKSATFFANNPVAFFIYHLHFLLVGLLLHFVSGFATFSSSAVELPMKQFEDDNPLAVFTAQTLHVFDVLGLRPSVGAGTHAVTTHGPRARYQIFSMRLQGAACHSVARVLQPTIISAQCCLVLSRVQNHVKPRPAELVCAGLVWFIVRLAFVLLHRECRIFCEVFLFVVASACRRFVGAAFMGALTAFCTHHASTRFSRFASNVQSSSQQHVGEHRSRT